MNPYFSPRTPEPHKLSVIDVVLRSLAGALAVLVVGVGIWITQDSIRTKVGLQNHAATGWNETTPTNVDGYTPNPTR
jgi:hypothetical protein